jgi:serine protease AprX
MIKSISYFLTFLLLVQPVLGGLTVLRSNGLTLTGADGIQFIGLSGITLTGADGLLGYRSNGIGLAGLDGSSPIATDSVTGANGLTYTAPNGITLTGADGITLTGADGITLSGTNGLTLTDVNGTTRTADSIFVRRPDGITLTGADGVTLTGADGVTLTGADGITLTGADGLTRFGLNGITLTGADGITLTGADGITLTGADGIALTGADSITGIGPNGVIFDLISPTGITLTGADDIGLTLADGVSLTGLSGISISGTTGLLPETPLTGLQGVDPDLLLLLDRLTDDSSLNAVVVFHGQVTENDLNSLRAIGILGGTRFRKLPMVYVSGTKHQIAAISRLPAVRSIYQNRTLQLNTDPYFDKTQIKRVPMDADLRTHNAGLSVTGRNVTVAVLDTGVNGLHPDLAGQVAGNVQLLDLQSVPLGFSYPIPITGLPTTDLVSGHGTFVAGIVAGNGAASNGKFAGVAPGAKVLGLSAGLLNLTHVLSGFDYILDRGDETNTRVVNCSFSAETPFDLNDPVNVATKMLTDAGVNVVFSAGNTGPGNGTLNPYAMAPWVIGVGATDRNGVLAGFSSRGNFGGELERPTLVAPGVSVASLRNIGTVTGTLGVAGADLSRLSLLELPFYTTASGTSFSAPQVAGAIALMLEVNPVLTPAEIKDILARSATPMPNNFLHEAGAGMLNTHAAVLEAAFPERRMGIFRSTITKNDVRFVTTTTGAYENTVVPGAFSTSEFTVPADTLQATATVRWGFGLNDFGLAVLRPNGSVAGESNVVNLPLLTARREKVFLNEPMAGIYRSRHYHTAGLGTQQNVFGAVEMTRVEYPLTNDLSTVDAASIASIRKMMRMGVMQPFGHKFKPQAGVTRVQFADSILRAGLVPQFVSAEPMFGDVSGALDRNAVESVQSAPQGRLLYDGSGGFFNPNSSVTKLAAAIAYVRAANLEHTTSTALLPLFLADRSAIPTEWRGHVAVALNMGFIRLDGNKFVPGRPINRLETANSLNNILSR